VGEYRDPRARVKVGSDATCEIAAVVPRVLI
jgi:hypothetical protein